MDDLKKLIELIEKLGYIGVYVYYGYAKCARVIVNESNDMIWYYYENGEWVL